MVLFVILVMLSLMASMDKSIYFSFNSSSTVKMAYGLLSNVCYGIDKVDTVGTGLVL